jgi:hypothetical protein
MTMDGSGSSSSGGGSSSGSSSSSGSGSSVEQHYTRSLSGPKASGPLALDAWRRSCAMVARGRSERRSCAREPP